MKRHPLVLPTVALLLILFISSAAMATQIPLQGDTMVLISYNSIDNAGIMTFNVSPEKGDPFTFDTFCIQDNVYITPGATNYVAQISNSVGFLNTSIAGATTLDYRVDYLFSKYSSGAYDNYFYSSNGQSNQADFQNLLWNLQGTGGTSYTTTGLPWDADLAFVEANHITGQTYGTHVINLTSGENGTGIDVQNMLEDPPIPSPEPSSLLLLGSGLTGMGWVIRRRK